MENLFKQYRYNGNVYKLSMPEFSAENNSKIEMQKLFEKGCNPYEISSFQVLKFCAKDKIPNFDKKKSCTSHWFNDTDQEAFEGLVSKGILQKCDEQEIASILKNVKSSDKNDIDLTNSDDTLLSNLIDYMDQLTLGSYFICDYLAKDGIFEPNSSVEFKELWDDRLKEIGLGMLEQYGYLRPAYRYKFSYGYETKKYKYYLFRKSIFQDFSDPLEEYI